MLTKISITNEHRNKIAQIDIDINCLKHKTPFLCSMLSVQTVKTSVMMMNTNPMEIHPNHRGKHQN